MATTDSKDSINAAAIDSAAAAPKPNQVSRDQSTSPETLPANPYSSTCSAHNQTSGSDATTELTSSHALQQDMNEQRLIELEEERKLKAKNPCLQRPGSEFLQKRLQRGLKYFDSGDYNMAKASTNPNAKLPDVATPITAIDSKILNKK